MALCATEVLVWDKDSWVDGPETPFFIRFHLNAVCQNHCHTAFHSKGDILVSWGISVSPAKTNLKSLAGWWNSQSKHQFSEKLLEKRKYLLSYVINPWCKILLHWKFLHMSYWCSFERYITAWRHLIIEILCSHWLKVKCCWSLNNDIQHCNINRSED